MKRFVKALGYLFTVAALVYLADIILHSDLESLRFKNPAMSIGFMLLFAVWASFFVVVGAYNWKLILEFINGSQLPAREVFPVYLRSNIAKYLPGNIMHYAGRNYLGSRLGWKHSEIALSSFLEYVFGFGLTGVVIMLFIALRLINLPPQVPLEINVAKLTAYSAVAAAVGLAFVYFHGYLGRKEGLAVTTRRVLTRGRQFFSVRFLVLFAKMFFVSLGCFVLNCMFYFYLCKLALDFHIRAEDFFNANAALSIANYMSIVTPGVPGGIGVKESVSTLMISAYGYPKENLVMSLVVFRLVCVLGDLLPYLVLSVRRNTPLEDTTAGY